MKLEMYTVYDSVVKAYMRPFFAQSTPAVIRSLSNELQNPNSQIAQNPEDYTLFRIASFDEQTGDFEVAAAPEKICTVIELVKSSEQPFSVVGGKNAKASN